MPKINSKPPKYFKTTVNARLKTLISPETLQDVLLAIFSESPSLIALRSLSNLQRAIVADYAARVHLRASDNLVRVPQKPDFIKLDGIKPTGNTGTLHDLIPQSEGKSKITITISGPRAIGKTCLAHKLAL